MGFLSVLPKGKRHNTLTFDDIFPSNGNVVITIRSVKKRDH